VRIDRWLCAVRLVKTRPIATQLCEAGHVRVNGNPAKPSTKVRAGDVVHALIAERERIVDVVRPIVRRVGAPDAATCYIDSRPAPTEEAEDGPDARHDRQVDMAQGRTNRQYLPSETIGELRSIAPTGVQPHFGAEPAVDVPNLHEAGVRLRVDDADTGRSDEHV